MYALKEGRVDLSVDAATLGIGERVCISTKMGRHVDEGIIVAASPFGISLKNGQYYKRDVYLFTPVSIEEKKDDKNSLQGLSPDERTRRKLMTMDMVESGIKKIDKQDASDKDDRNDGQDVETNDKGDGKASVNKLPDDIKKAIKTSYKMQDSQIESVLYEIAETTMDALRKEHVPDGQIYDLVSMVRDAAEKILKGKEISRTKRG